MKSYILLFALTLCMQIEANPKKHSAQDFIHATLVSKSDRKCRAARLKAKEKDLKRKKDRDAKYAWLLQEELSPSQGCSNSEAKLSSTRKRRNSDIFDTPEIIDGVMTYTEFWTDRETGVEYSETIVRKRAHTIE